MPTSMGVWGMPLTPKKRKKGEEGWREGETDGGVEGGMKEMEEGGK